MPSFELVTIKKAPGGFEFRVCKRYNLIEAFLRGRKETLLHFFYSPGMKFFSTAPRGSTFVPPLGLERKVKRWIKNFEKTGNPQQKLGI